MTEMGLSPIGKEAQRPLNKQTETKKKLWIRTDFVGLRAMDPALKTPSPPGKIGGPGEKLLVIGFAYFFFFALGFAFFFAAIDLLPSWD
ncbi:MAG TPA: hypothetical protein VFL79_00860 [Terriglobia bacterium]|nr:hypothetical protein [Terriglobia bacterium]